MSSFFGNLISAGTNAFLGSQISGGNQQGFDWGSLLGGLFSAASNIYASKKSYDAQKDAAELQAEAAQEQVKQAGFQEQMAGQQEQAAMESQRLAELNAVDAEVSNAREQENLRLSQAAEQSEARARAAASGVVIDSGSTGGFLDAKEQNAAGQLGWMKQVGESEVRNIRTEGETAKQQGLATAMGTRASAAGTRAQAAGTKAASKTTKAGAYNSALTGVNNIFDIGKRNAWF